MTISSILSLKSHAMSANGNCARTFTGLTFVGTVLLGLVAAGCTRDPVSSTPASAAASAAPAPQAATEQAKATLYKCPMHPNVTSDKPGKCPECGMNLEKEP